MRRTIALAEGIIGTVAADTMFEPIQDAGDFNAVPIVVQGETNMFFGTTEFPIGTTFALGPKNATVMQSDSQTQAGMCKVYIH